MWDICISEKQLNCWERDRGGLRVISQWDGARIYPHLDLHLHSARAQFLSLNRFLRSYTKKRIHLNLVIWPGIGLGDYSFAGTH